jgi:hypothetical protein
VNHVHLLWFVREGLEAEEADILVGVYSTEECAKAAIQRLKNKPGFADRLEGFEIAEYEVDDDHWEEGFKFVE